MTRLRWRLAHWIAPGPIMYDPLGKEQDGAFIVTRESGYDAVIVLDTVKITSERRMPDLDGISWDYMVPQRTGKVEGTW